LLGIVERCAPGLVEVRAASQLKECEFKDDLLELSSAGSNSRVIDMVRLGQALALEGCLRVGRHDLEGALDDAQALFAMSDHLAGTPLILYVMVAHAVRSLGYEVLARLSAAPELSPEHLDRALAVLPRPLMESLPDALAMEEAWGLEALGRWGAPDASWFGGTWVAGYDSLHRSLYRAFFLDDDALGFRTGMAEVRLLAASSLAQQKEAAARFEEERLGEIAPRGLMAPLLAGPHVARLIAVRSSDAKLTLVQLALRAAAWRLERGAWPTSSKELGVSGVRFVLDEQGLTLTDSDPAWGADAPTLHIAALR
jgi:hypothetical protein